MEVSNTSALNTTQPTQTQKTQGVIHSSAIKNQHQDTSGSNSQNTDINQLLKQTLHNLLKNLSSDPMTKADILEMLKGVNLFKDFQNASSLLKGILSSIQSNPSLQKYQSVIQSFLFDIENLNGENLKNNITNSGVFLESKLLNNQKMGIANDMKAVLLNIKKELENSTVTNENKESLKQVDKMLLQIDYYQLLSLTSSTQYLYFPFDWDMLDDGELSFKKEEEDHFVCDINLELKNYGKVNLRIMMYDEDKLDINIAIEQEKFKESLLIHLPKLKLALYKAGIPLTGFKIGKIQPEPTPTPKNTNPYENKTSLDLHVDIRA